MDHFETILFSTQKGYAKIELNRPQTLNSFNQKMHDEIQSIMPEVRTNPDIRCLLITGAGKAFSAGQDLNDRKPVAPGKKRDLAASLDKNYYPLINFITQLDKPVICAVNGVAAGGGSAIALMCDIIIAARSASFIPTFTKIGLMPDLGGTWYWPRLAGHARAMAALLLAEKITAQQAADWGMIWKVVEDDLLKKEAQSIAERLATMPPLALAKTKQALLDSSTNTLQEQLALERKGQLTLGNTEDYAEGVKSFFEKRKPTFKGQ